VTAANRISLRISGKRPPDLRRSPANFREDQSGGHVPNDVTRVKHPGAREHLQRAPRSLRFSLKPERAEGTSGGIRKSLRISGDECIIQAEMRHPSGMEGTNRYMQNIQKNPMVTVAEAAAALGIDERTVREKLSKEEWKGEKRLIGMKEKWFMYRGELDRQVERLRIARPQERISTQGIETVFEAEDATEAQTIDAQAVEVGNSHRTTENISIAIDEVLSKLAEQFSKQLHAEKEVIFALQKELEDKDRRLKLLPDLEKQAEEQRKSAELKELESEALRKQIAAMQDEQQQAEEAKRQATEEIARLREEKEAQAAAIQEELRALSATVEELKRPKPSWWKRMFSAQEN
jgi:hypothetical protein